MKHYWTSDGKCIGEGVIRGEDITGMTNNEVYKLRMRRYKQNTKKADNYDKSNMYQAYKQWSEDEQRYKLWGREGTLIEGYDITDLSKLDIDRIRKKVCDYNKRNNMTYEQRKKYNNSRRERYFKQQGREFEEYKKPGPKIKY